MYLTKRQRDVYNYIHRFIKQNGYSPSLEEISIGIGVSSLATVHKHLKSLEEKGIISRKWNHSRSIEIKTTFDYPNTVEVPLLGVVAAGEPIEAIEDRRTISVPQEFLRGRETFVLRVQGDSMIEEHIRDGDYIVVERRNVAENGEVVVALIDGREATVKRFYRENGHIRLQPENPTMKPLILPAERVQVRGIVIGLMRKY